MPKVRDGKKKKDSMKSLASLSPSEGGVVGEEEAQFLLRSIISNSLVSFQLFFI